MMDASRFGDLGRYTIAAVSTRLELRVILDDGSYEVVAHLLVFPDDVPLATFMDIAVVHANGDAAAVHRKADEHNKHVRELRREAV